MSASATNRRIVVLAVFFALLLGTTLARAFWLQGIKGAQYAAMALRQHRETVVVPAGRGTIFDRSGDPLAIGEQAITVYANPRQVVNPREVTLAVSRLLHLDPEQVYPLLADRSKGFVYVERKAEPAKAAALEKRHIPGLGFYPEERRTYPQGRVAAQVLGFAGTDNTGLEGLEKSLDPTLAGKPGSETIVKDPAGRALSVASTRPETPGSNVRLTIDSQIQATAEDVLARTVRQWGAKAATAIVMDPYTGAVLAMAVAPGFNANHFATTRDDRHRNRAVTDTYEPGSTFKLVTISAALQEGLVTPRTSFELAPTIQVADRVIHEAEARGTERMTVAQIVARSSNIGTVTIAERLGAGRLASWINRYGFGQQTGIDFPGESPAFALPLDQWSGSTIGTVPIGQGISVTPLQMARAYSAIANGGRLVTPHLVDRVGGRTVEHGPGRRVVSGKVSKEMLSMLRGVVLEGTGTAAAIPGYTVAGKTGTAAKVDPNGHYSTTNYVASFVGMVPATKPRLVIMAMVDEPRGAIWGGVVAAPAFQQIARFCLQHLEVPPDAPSTAKN
ncbi:MAG: penicillin-binding protein 2 [Actinobacteria bacterium]|nr:MAG: penicillin-binding protein 2 [Actinomycetota bacterium]TML46976.1 MAG: penicillin-binding protein 2 [Actinomycetota bacterium]TML73876.1 MAG: penicillin-binding protein 2 [Actinomycetota bacterium]